MVPRKHSIPLTVAIGSSNATSSEKPSLIHTHVQVDPGTASLGWYLPFSTSVQRRLGTWPFPPIRLKFLEAMSSAGYIYKRMQEGKSVSTGKGALRDLWDHRLLLSSLGVVSRPPPSSLPEPLQQPPNWFPSL